MSVFAQVWFWTLIAFFVGALLLWVLVARPAMQRAKEWERQAKTGTATQRRSSVDERDRDSGYAGAPPAPWRGEPDQGAPAERETPSGPTRWMERDSFAGMSTPAGAEIDERVEEGSAGRRYADQEYGVAEEYPLGEGRYPAGDQYAEQEYAEQRYAELEQAYDTERRYDIGVSEQPTRDEGVPGSMFEPTQSDLPSEPDQRSPLAAALEPDSGTSVADRLDGGYTGELQQLDEIDTEGQLVGREPETAEGAPVGALFEPTAPTAHTDSLFTEQAATAEPTDRAYAEQEDASTEFTEFQDEADTESADRKSVV